MHEPERRTAPSILVKPLPEQPETAALAVLDPVIIARAGQGGDRLTPVSLFQLGPDPLDQGGIGALVELGVQPFAVDAFWAVGGWRRRGPGSPFRRQPFRPVGAGHRMRHPAPDEAERRAVRHFGQHLYLFRRIDQADRARPLRGRQPGGLGQVTIEPDGLFALFRKVALNRLSHRHGLFAKLGNDPVSQRGQHDGVCIARSKVARKGNGADFHRPCPARFQHQEVDPEARVDPVQLFRKEAQDMFRGAHGAGERDGDGAYLPIGAEGVIGKGPRALSKRGKLRAEILGKLFKTARDPLCGQQGFRAGQAGDMGRRFGEGRQRLMAQAERLIEAQQNRVGGGARLEAPAKRLAVYAVELANRAQAKAFEQCFGLIGEAERTDR